MRHLFAFAYGMLWLPACVPAAQTPLTNTPALPEADCDNDASPDMDGPVLDVTDCGAQALQAAVDAAAAGTTLRLLCGQQTTVLTAPLLLNRDLTIDGLGAVTLDGQHASRHVDIASSFDLSTPRIVLRGLNFRRGQAHGTTTTDGGGSIRAIGGSLSVEGCDFDDNHTEAAGQDLAGGAIFAFGVGDLVVADSTLSNNTAANGGAIGAHHRQLRVRDTSFVHNAATGVGGNPGNGGNGGSVVVDGLGNDVSLCRVRIDDSTANAFGGAFFRVGYDNADATLLTGVAIDEASLPDNEPSMGGAVYSQGTSLALRQVRVTRSHAVHAGGVYVGPGSIVLFENVWLAHNEARNGLGGALVLDAVDSGTISHASMVDNAAVGNNAFAGAIAGNGANVVLRSSLILDSVAGNAFNPRSCSTVLASGEASFQFPVAREGGGSDAPDALCAPQVVVGAVELDSDGRPTASSLARAAAANDCPAVDVDGTTRPAQNCSAGALE